MSKPGVEPKTLTLTFSFLLTFCVFGVDVVLLHDYALWHLFVIPILIARTTGIRAQTIIVTLTCTLLTAFGFMMQADRSLQELVTRVLGVIVFWFVARFNLAGGTVPQHSMQGDDTPKNADSWISLRIALGYVLLAGAWISISDKLLAAFVQDQNLLMQISEAKGWLFVLFTGTLLYAMLYRYTASRIKIENDLRRNEKRLNQITATTPTYISEIDRNGNIVFANRTYRGVPPEQFIGTQLSSWYPEHQQELVQRLIEAMFTSGVARTFEYSLPDAVGVQHTYSATITPLNISSTNLCAVVTATDISARKRHEEALRESEQRYRLLFETSMDAVILMSSDGQILSANPAACQIFGRTIEEMLRLDRSHIIDTTDPLFATAMEQSSLNGVFHGELTFLGADGKKFPGEISSSLFVDEEMRTHASMIVRDITQRKRDEQNLLKLNRVYQVISQIDQVIVKVRTKEDLFHDSCRIAVKYGKFRMAWIGLIDAQRQTIEPVAFDGAEDGYLAHVQHLPLSDIPEGRGPAGSAIRYGSYQYCNDIEHDVAMAPWRDEALKRGYRSCISLPIRVHHNVIGAFTLYTSEPGFFNDEETDSLEDIARDISFALENLEREERNKFAEKERLQQTVLLKNFNQRLSLATEVASIGVWDLDVKTNNATWNDKMFEIYALEKESTLSYEQWKKSVLPKDVAKMERSIQKVIKRKIQDYVEFRIVRPDGSRRFIEAAAGIIEDDFHNVIRVVGINIDATDRRKANEQLRYQANLLNHFNDAIVGANDHNIITEWNEAAEAMYGWEAAEVVGNKSFDILETEYATGESMEILATIRRTGKWRGEVIQKSKDGTRIPVEMASIALHDDAGLISGYASVNRDITQRRETQDALRKSEERLRMLSGYLQRVREEERKRIAREIHDELGQELTALKMDVVFFLKSLVEHEDMTNRPDYQEKVRSLTGIVDTAIRTVRRIATELRPDVLDKLGLIDALQWQADEFSKRTGILCELHAASNENEFDEQFSTAIFRIFQETLTNVARHAHASYVRASLAIVRGEVHFTISDNGRGISPEEIANSTSLGLLGIRERVVLLGGAFRIHGEQGKGTTLTVEIPLTTRSTNHPSNMRG